MSWRNGLKSIFGLCDLWQLTRRTRAPGPSRRARIDWLGPERIMEVYGGSELFGDTVITGREWLSYKGSLGSS